MYRIPTLLVLLILAACHADADSSALSTAIRIGIDNAGTPYELEVFCTDAQSRRSATVFRGTAGVWNGRQQVTLQEEDRRALLELLLDRGFPSFKERYGERQKADKQEAPLRVVCRVNITIEGREKSSVQLLDGERSQDLVGLAGALLDRIETLAANSIVAANLEDGLRMLSTGELAPELLELRLLRFPNDGEDATGYILRMRGGRISRQQYRPGELIGDAEILPVEGCAVREFAGDMSNAALWDLPRNMRYEEISELEVAVLGARHSVGARPGYPNVDADALARFETLLERIEVFSSACMDNR